MKEVCFLPVFQVLFAEMLQCEHRHDGIAQKEIFWHYYLLHGISASRVRCREAHADFPAARFTATYLSNWVKALPLRMAFFFGDGDIDLDRCD